MLPLLVHGNSCVELVRASAGATPSGFRPLNWRLLEPRWIDDDVEEPIDYWIYNAVSGRRTIQPRDLIHIAWHPPAGKIGVSPLKQLGVTLRIERAAQLWQESLFKNSARPSGGLTMPEVAAGDSEAAKALRREIRDDIERTLQGERNAGRPILLPPGADWRPFSYNASEAELIEQRKLTREEVAGVYDVPPPMIGILDKATFSNIETQHKMLYSDALGPYLTLVAETLTVRLREEPAFADQWLEFDVKEFLRGNPVQEAAAEKTEIFSGTLTIDEARDAKNRPRFGGIASKPLILTSNLAPLESLGGAEDDDEPPDDPPEPDEE